MMASSKLLLSLSILWVSFAHSHCRNAETSRTSNGIGLVRSSDATSDNFGGVENWSREKLLQSADVASSDYGVHFNTQDESQEVMRSELPVELSSSDSPKPRLKRSIPSDLAEIFKRAYTSPGLQGDVLYMAKQLCDINFNIERGVFKKSDILAAEVHLYKVAPKKVILKSRKGRKPVLHARVSVHQVIRRRKRLPSTTKMLDSSLVRIDESGWMKFDVTKAFKSWVRSKRSNKGIEIWVESIEPGNHAAKMARKVKFVKPDDKRSSNRPALVVYFKKKGPKQQKNSSPLNNS